MKARLIRTLGVASVLVLAGVVAGAGSSSRVLAQAAKGRTQTTVQASVKRAVYGQKVKLTATVTRLSGTGKFTGEVTFYAGLTKVGQGTLIFSGNESISGSNPWTGPVTFTVTLLDALALGTNTITAVYSGNSSFTGSTSRKLNLNVTKATATTVVGAGATLQFEYGEPVTLTATVTAKAPSHAVPTGTVTFLDGPAKLGSATLKRGKATLTTRLLTVGEHSITTQNTYRGNTFVNAGVLELKVTVGKAATTTTAVSSANPSVFGQSVTFTATVSANAPGAGTPTGTVTFMGGVFVASGDVNGDGRASVTTSLLGVGEHTITVAYSGNQNFADGETLVHLAVNKAATTTVAVKSVNESPTGLTVTFTATVSPVAPGTGTPTETVSFYDGSENLGSCILSEGRCSHTQPGGVPFEGPLSARYSGDGSFNGSSSTVE